MATLDIAPHYTYRIEEDKLSRCSSGFFHSQLLYSYKVYYQPLKVGDIIADFDMLPKGPYRVTEIGSTQDGKFARIKEIPYIEYIKKQGELRHIYDAQFPFRDNIISVLYNIRRSDNEFFFRDMVFVTKGGYMFSYDDVMKSETLENDRWPLKKYLPAIINATEVYTACHSIADGIKFFTKLIIPSQIQIGKYNNKYDFHINLNPGSGYYWV